LPIHSKENPKNIGNPSSPPSARAKITANATLAKNAQISNPYSQYGSPYSPIKPNNPYATQAPILCGDDE